MVLQPPTPSCPPELRPVLPLALACREAGGRALVVGGAVRDLLLRQHHPDLMVPPPLPVDLRLSQSPPFPAGGTGPVDLDVEVHGLPRRTLERVLRGLGRINLVGQSFSVYKLTLDDTELDVSLPRHDSKVGPGHRGIDARGDPFLGIREAARRRDLTLNAIALDPLSGALEDPFHGEDDLRIGVLRAVDDETFLEDPLRALRMLQFAARFRFPPDDALERLCQAAPLHELPAERIRGELQKLLLKAPAPSHGLWLEARLHLVAAVLPDLTSHPWERVCPAIDRAAHLRRGALSPRDPAGEALLLGVLLHPLPPDALERVLDRLAIFTQGHFPVRAAIQALVTRHGHLTPALSDGRLRLLARDLEPAGGLGLLVLGAWAISGDPAWRATWHRLVAQDLRYRPPGPLLRGRDLARAGIAPGPDMGRLLQALYDIQLEEGIAEPADLQLRLPGFQGTPPT